MYDKYSRALDASRENIQLLKNQLVDFFSFLWAIFACIDQSLKK